VDGVYQDIAEALKPGIKESEIVALATSRLYQMGSDCVERSTRFQASVLAAPAQLHRPSHPPGRPGLLRYHPVVHGLPHLLLPHFHVGRATAPQRTAYRRAREWIDKAIELLKPGMSSDKIARRVPGGEGIGFSSEMEAFGLNFCHGLGLGLHERPLDLALTSFKEPIE